MRADYRKGVKGTLRSRRGGSRRPRQAEWYARSTPHRELGRAIESTVKPIPPHKEKALATFVAAGGTAPGANRTLAGIWKEWR